MADQELIDLTATTTPADGDVLYTVVDPAVTPLDRKITWTTIKAFLKTYFDGIYQAVGTYLTSANIEDNITDGHTTIAPSGNAVFDALALKAPLASPTFTGTVNAADIRTGLIGVAGATPTALNPFYVNVPNSGAFVLNGEAGINNSAAMKWLSGGSERAAFTYDDLNNNLRMFTIAGDIKILTDNTEGRGIIIKTGTGSVQVPTLELGHATDTTISRVSAGEIAVEGIPIIKAGSTTIGQVPTITGTNTYSWQTPSSGGSSLWTLMPGTPTRVGNTSFTVTGDVTAYVAKGMIIKWTESSTVRVAMVSIPSTYSSPNTTITIIGDTMASIDASSLKYCMLGVEMFKKNFAVAGNIGAVATDIANAYYATEPMRVLGADLQVGTAGTTNSTTIDINVAGTSVFTTKPTLATTVAASPTPFTANSGTSLTLNQRVSIDVDAIQTTNAVDLYVQLYLIPTRYLSLS